MRGFGVNEAKQKKPVFYCQLDYADRPYPGPDGRGTIADNGCGPCCAAMVAENLLGVSFPPWEAAELAIACGAREKPGTDLYIFAPVFAQKMGLNLTVTESVDEGMMFLRAHKGLIIANTRGDRPEDGWIGVFSDSGHYIVLAGADGTQVRVWDPMYRPGRYEVPGRRGKVRMEGQEALADVSVIREDCHERSLFLFGIRQPWSQNPDECR